MKVPPLATPHGPVGYQTSLGTRVVIQMSKSQRPGDPGECSSAP